MKAGITINHHLTPQYPEDMSHDEVQKRRKMFGVRGLIIIHEHREGNWLINIHDIALRVAVVNMLPFLEPLRWTNTATL